MKRLMHTLTTVSLMTALLTTAAEAQKRKPAAKPQAEPAAAAAAPATAEPAQPVATATAPAAAPATEEKWYDTVKISGMVRVRPEVKENFAFDDSQRYNFVGNKVWLTAEKEFKDKTKVVITLQDVRVWGGQNPSITDTGTEQQSTDIREAYVQLKNFFWSPFDLKVGRQKIALGEEMLVGALDWANVGRSFDGARLIWNTSVNDLSIFSTIIQENNSNDLNNANSPKNSPGVYFSGIYDTLKLHKSFWLDTFVFARNQDGSAHSNQLYTFGARFHNRTEAGNKTASDQLIDYSIDVAYQGGQKGGQEIQAYGGVAFIGVNFNPGLKMRIGGQGAYASGDDDATDGKYQTFDPMYPTPHYQFGQADMTSWRNLMGGGVNYTIWFTQDFNLKLDYWYAMRQNGNDSWYSIGGIAFNSAGLGTEKQLYQEFGLLANYQARSYLAFQAGYSYAMRGKAMELANKSGDYQFAYLMSTISF
ncbi:MAG TPA: alginate export family protein [Turneriella sp.]|nr:alginate export family protein [Turneriella sp.]